jgi:hypothetical protein
MELPQKHPRGKILRLKTDQVLCSFGSCGMPAGFAVYRQLGSQIREVQAYCEKHAEETASELGLEMPR